jgi:hypothetical protein
MMMIYIYICEVILYWFSTFESLIGQLSGFRIRYQLWCIIFYLASTTSYISVFSPYLCANVFIWCCCCFICLKFWKQWQYFVFCNFCRGFPIFCRLFPKRCFPDPHWLFANADFFNNGSESSLSIVEIKNLREQRGSRVQVGHQKSNASFVLHIGKAPIQGFEWIL